MSEHSAEGGRNEPSNADWITSADTARILVITPETLRSYRARGDGSSPPFRKFGQAVVYSRTEVEAFLSSRKEG